ncbi:MFS transporter [Salmonella enterica]|nr:MFS transporter [Salmonella enterica]
MKRKTMGWLIVFLLFIVYMLNYMDRSALSITAPLIEKELGFNAAEMGMIFSAFFIGYALFNFIGGWASDKVGPKTVFLIAALLWSVFCGLTGLVTGLWTMLIVRVLFGMAEGPVSAAGNKIINNWISRKESATAIGIRNTLDLASFAGRISFTGWPKQETSLPTNLITYKELDLRGSRTSAGEFDEALRMLSTLEINPQDVVSKVVNLDEIPDAVKELDRYPERYLKINAVFH